MAELTHEVQPEAAAEEVPQYVPTVYLEVSKEQLDMLEVGNSVCIKLHGKVKGLQANEADKAKNRYEISLELQEVKIDPKENEFTRMVEDDE